MSHDTMRVASLEPHAKSMPPEETRLMSLDAYRGAIMLFMASAGFGLPEVAKHFPDSAVWRCLAFHTSHATWVGGGAWDMIQPAFMFMVGVALPYSYARRMLAGHSFARLFSHALWRAAVLVAIAVFLASKNAQQTVFLFTNVLGQIGRGYPVLFLLLGRGWNVQVAALVTIAALYWALFAFYPLPPADFDYSQYDVKESELSEVTLPGFFAHWNKHVNAAADFDRWFLNLFPREIVFRFNPGGYQTLNFVPSLITMILGLLTGEMLRSERSLNAKWLWMLLVGAATFGAGWLAGETVCPLVKRIWTPSWALYSGGIVLWMLAAFYGVIDLLRIRSWSLPLVIVGMNSIAIYLMEQLLPGWIAATLKTHLGSDIFGGTYGIIIQRCTVLVIFWLVCWWMYRRKVFLRI